MIIVKQVFDENNKIKRLVCREIKLLEVQPPAAAVPSSFEPTPADEPSIIRPSVIQQMKQKLSQKKTGDDTDAIPPEAPKSAVTSAQTSPVKSIPPWQRKKAAEAEALIAQSAISSSVDGLNKDEPQPPLKKASSEFQLKQKSMPDLLDTAETSVAQRKALFGSSVTSSKTTPAVARQPLKVSIADKQYKNKSSTQLIPDVTTSPPPSTDTAGKVVTFAPEDSVGAVSDVAIEVEEERPAGFGDSAVTVLGEHFHLCLIRARQMNILFSAAAAVKRNASMHINRLPFSQSLSWLAFTCLIPAHIT